MQYFIIFEQWKEDSFFLYSLDKAHFLIHLKR